MIIYDHMSSEIKCSGRLQGQRAVVDCSGISAIKTLRQTYRHGDYRTESAQWGQFSENKFRNPSNIFVLFLVFPRNSFSFNSPSDKNFDYLRGRLTSECSHQIQNESSSSKHLVYICVYVYTHEYFLCIFYPLLLPALCSIFPGKIQFQFGAKVYIQIPDIKLETGNSNNCYHTSFPTVNSNSCYHTSF